MKDPRNWRDDTSFPPLPPSPIEVGDLILQMREHVQALGWGNREQLYTASQVRSMISAAMAAERERCAVVGGAAADAGMDGAGVAAAIRRPNASLSGGRRPSA